MMKKSLTTSNRQNSKIDPDFLRRKNGSLHELIDRITIYETPGMGRCRKGKEKRITIYYKFVGAIQ